MTTLLLLLYGLVAALWVSLVVLCTKKPTSPSGALLLVAIVAAGAVWPALALFAIGYYLLGRGSRL